MFIIKETNEKEKDEHNVSMTSEQENQYKEQIIQLQKELELEKENLKQSKSILV